MQRGERGVVVAISVGINGDCDAGKTVSPLAVLNADTGYMKCAGWMRRRGLTGAIVVKVGGVNTPHPREGLARGTAVDGECGADQGMAGRVREGVESGGSGGGEREGGEEEEGEERERKGAVRRGH